MRFPAALCVAAAIVLTALPTRELGGGRWAQALCAWGYAFAGVPLVFGHIMLTATVDLPVWAATILFVLRALRRGQPRWWLAAGAVVGLALDMAAALSADKGGETRVLLLPLQLIMLGPPLGAIRVALLRRPGWRAARALAVAYPVLIVIVFVAGGQFYYPLGLLGFLFAAGCVPVVDWTSRRPGIRRPLIAAALAVNTAVTPLLALPLIPADRLGDTRSGRSTRAPGTRSAGPRTPARGPRCIAAWRRRTGPGRCC